MRDIKLIFLNANATNIVDDTDIVLHSYKVLITPYSLVI